MRIIFNWIAIPTLILIILKVFGVIKWHWWWIISPIWIPILSGICIVMWILIIFWIDNKNIKVYPK